MYRMVSLISKSAKETQKIAGILADEAIQHRVFLRPPSVFNGGGAVVVALEGNLGSGKTTFVQGFARALGIKENVLSPTFVLMKVYPLYTNRREPARSRPSFGGKKLGLERAHEQTRTANFKHLIHIDCYRLGSPQDLLHLGFKDLLSDKDAVILIEWAERVRKLIPRDALWVRFSHGRNPSERVIKFKVQNIKFKTTI